MNVAREGKGKGKGKGKGTHKHPRRPWRPHELELLRRKYADSVTGDIAIALGRPVGHVYAQAGKLGLRKGDAFLATDVSGRILKGGKLGQATQFQPGITPWNKGTHYVAPGRSSETRFKPGARPHTWLPVGSYRVNSDGYLDRKVNDQPGPNSVRWHPVHRLVWQAANGAVPAGHLVVFKPGRQTIVLAEISLDAVELITRREHMRRNSVHNLPRELAQLVQLRGAVNRAINQRAKEAQPT